VKNTFEDVISAFFVLFLTHVQQQTGYVEQNWCCSLAVFSFNIIVNGQLFHFLVEMISKESHRLLMIIIYIPSYDYNM